MAKIRVFADTNVILESFRTNCWTAISNHFSIETVQKCVEETLTGNPSDRHHINVHPTILHKSLAGQHPVTDKELVSLVLNYPFCSTLDDGEKHLLAWLFANKRLMSSPTVVLTTADKAALNAIHKLEWLDYAVSLENLARQAGVANKNLRSLALQYREDWLARIKLNIRIDSFS